VGHDTTTQCLLFPEIFSKPVLAQFDQRQGSSDGGAILLKAADRRLGLTESLASCLADPRQPGKVEHETERLLAQRIFAIACGYADANDAARLAEDPVHKMLAGRDPAGDADLASQPTLCRFENAPDRKQLYRMGVALADGVIERHRRRLHGRARLITIDLDPTDDPTHGAQQLSFFNGHYDSWCYLPLLGFVSFNDEGEQYLLTAVLRPGNAPAKAGAIGILLRVLQRLWKAFPKARIRVRLDGGFADPLVLEFLDAMGVEYVVAMAKNAVLERLAEPAMKQARRLSKQSGQTEHVYGEGRYRAKSWSSERKVIFKAEVVRHPGKEPKDNPRFVITNLKQNPQGSGKNGLRAGAGLDSARAGAQVGSARRGLGAPGGDSSSRLVSVPGQFPPDRPQFRRAERIAGLPDDRPAEQFPQPHRSRGRVAKFCAFARGRAE
jgi:hypothetical protein